MRSLLLYGICYDFSAIDGKRRRRGWKTDRLTLIGEYDSLFAVSTGWDKTIGPIAKTMLRGIERIGALFTLALVGYHRARLPRLLAA